MQAAKEKVLVMKNSKTENQAKKSQGKKDQEKKDQEKKSWEKKDQTKKSREKKDQAKKSRGKKDQEKKSRDKKDRAKKDQLKKDKRTRGKAAAGTATSKGSITDEEVREILDILRQRKEYVTTVESLTAGMISSRIADIPGSSDVLRRAFVTYSDEAKHEMVHVKRKTLEQYTAVSRQTAKQMAKGGAKKAGAAACVSATGYAGPPAGPDDKTVGLVYLGCCYHGKTIVEEHHYSGQRNEIRAMAMTDGLRLLQRMLR